MDGESSKLDMLEFLLHLVKTGLEAERSCNFGRTSYKVIFQPCFTSGFPPWSLPAPSF